MAPVVTEMSKIRVLGQPVSAFLASFIGCLIVVTLLVRDALIRWFWCCLLIRVALAMQVLSLVVGPPVAHRTFLFPAKSSWKTVWTLLTVFASTTVTAGFLPVLTTLLSVFLCTDDAVRRRIRSLLHCCFLIS